MERQETESLWNLYQGVKQGKILLPEFQRNFVWELNKTYDLFDSIFRGIFIGAFIYGIPSFPITVREFDLRPRRGKGSRKKLKTWLLQEDELKRNLGQIRLVLDGQQRITAFCRALEGIDKVWIVLKNSAEMEESQQNISRLEDIEDWLYGVQGEEDPHRLSIPVDYLLKSEMEDLWQEDQEKFFREETAYGKSLSDEQAKKEFKRFLKIGKYFHTHVLHGEKLLSYYLLDTSLDKFALFFERSNSRLVQLDFLDILIAKLYTGFNLREALEALEEEIKPYPVHREVLVRTISFLVSNSSVDKAYILRHLTPDHFHQYWHPVCNNYRKIWGFLQNERLLVHPNWLPYSNMLIPLEILLTEIQDFANLSESQRIFLHLWWWSSIFHQRYTTATGTTVETDCKIFQKLAREKLDSEKQYFQKLSRFPFDSPEDLLNYRRKRNVVYMGILNFLHYCSPQGLLGWQNAQKLDFQNQVEAHHIFPRAYLQSQKQEDWLELQNSVLNQALIPKITNLKVRDLPPSQYLQKLQAQNEKLTESLESHCIPTGILSGQYDHDFARFLQDRAEKIWEKLQTFWEDYTRSCQPLFGMQPKV